MLSSEDVKNAQNTRSVDKLEKGLETSLPSIFVQLTEEKSKTSLESSDEASMMKPYMENFTVVLRSKQPTQWILSSSVKHSNIIVVASISVMF